MKEKSRSPPKRSNGRFLLILACLPTTCKNTDAYRLGTFQLIRQWLYAFPLQLHNHTDSDWCLCIGRFSVLPLLLRQFQEATAPSKAGKNDTGK